MSRAHPAPLVVIALAGLGCATSRTTAPQQADQLCRCAPGQPCWPSDAEWQGFGAGLHGTLEQPKPLLVECTTSPSADTCAAALKNSKNPFFLQDQPGGTQSTGWLGAWSYAPSAYAVVAADAADVAASVNFARSHGIRLVIKGTGHDYLGRSNAPDSLLVWTHNMRRISMYDAFVPTGCPMTTASRAVSLEAGTRWLEAYQEVTVNNGRYVQGGGCTTVGAVGGFLQGGGFGSWSKKYGVAAASMLEAEVVTADGRQLVANACQNEDLFWALRGGGGGTFGIVTRATLKTHPLPKYFGAFGGSIAAKNDAAFKELLERFAAFYRERLSNEHWGEQVRVRGNNSLELSMTFEGMTAKEAEQVWQPLRAWVDERKDTLTMKIGPVVAFPASRIWDAAFLQKHAPRSILRDDRPGVPGDWFWWEGDGEQVSAYWYAYQSRWIPLRLFQGDNAKRLAEMLFQASRHWSVGLHFNKGQAGASVEAVRAGREISMNPAVYDAAALAIIAAEGSGYPGVPGQEPDRAKGENAKARVAAAMKVIRDATPGAGSYVNETDYFEPNWQKAFWGTNYDRLLQIKRKYDPDGLFYCHHCVGSENWSADGRCKAAH